MYSLWRQFFISKILFRKWSFSVGSNQYYRPDLSFSERHPTSAQSPPLISLALTIPISPLRFLMFLFICCFIGSKNWNGQQIWTVFISDKMVDNLMWTKRLNFQVLDAVKVNLDWIAYTYFFIITYRLFCLDVLI